MKHPTTVLSAAALLAGCMLQLACAGPSPISGPVYDFEWHLSGAAEARPYQVFDDGQRIYLQFDDPQHIPAVFADTPAGLVLLHWHPDPPYVIVNQMEPALVFRADNEEARAVRVAPHGPPHIAHFGDASPTQTPPPRSTAR